MRVAYFDCFAGISGDMIVGAQLDLGVELEALKSQLASLEITGFEISSRRVKRGAISATKFEVELNQQVQPERSLADVKSTIQRSSLSELTKRRSIAAFGLLAEAEARVHGITPDQVHFHEVGGVDSMVDVVGAMIGFEMLGVDRFFCSPLRVGSGLIETEHGRLPVPAPATVELLKGVPIYSGELVGEFVTPTGAAIALALCEKFGTLPEMSLTKIGYGAGTRDPKQLPNTLRLMMGYIDDEPDSASSDETIVVIETNIDDMNPQAYGFVMDSAFALGALDVFMLPAQMKKDRPGVLLTILCNPETANPMMDMLLSETTTLGARYSEAKRRVLERIVESVDTQYGRVRVKVARDGARTLHFQPEYEDCARLAAETGAPLLEVQAAAAAAYREKLNQNR